MGALDEWAERGGIGETREVSPTQENKNKNKIEK
jgi:hypothetical protein